MMINISNASIRDPYDINLLKWLKCNSNNFQIHLYLVFKDIMIRGCSSEVATVRKPERRCP